MNKGEPVPILTHRTFRSLFPPYQLPSGLTAWMLLSALLVLYCIPYMFKRFDSLGIYQAVILLPVMGAALLLTYQGTLFVWGCSLIIMLLLRAAQGDQFWSADVFSSVYFTYLLILPIGLIMARMASVSRQLRRLHHQLAAAHHELTIANADIQLQALTDPLTGLPNHRAIMGQIDAELQRCQTSQLNCAIIFADVDHFKQINDTWGHGAGDVVLHSIGQHLQANVRREDYIGRYGGEEFAILLTDIEQEGAYELAERLRCSIAEQPCLWKSKETEPVISIAVTASFGLAVYPLDGITRKDLIETADQAMYHAKQSGRNRVCPSNEESLEMQDLQASGDLLQYREHGVMQALSTATHDQGTYAHALPLLQLAEATARFLGRSEEEVLLIRLAAELHDIGKIGVPASILHKPGSLTTEEWSVMRLHPEMSQRILAQAGGRCQLISHIVVAHHERWDGQGYPYGLVQNEIPLGARILAVVDSYDAMTSTRPYREALSRDKAQQELLQGKGSQYDPEVVDAFLMCAATTRSTHERHIFSK